MSKIFERDIIPRLSSYFADRPDTAFAFLFGSRARGEERGWSDVDIALYFYPKGGELEIEEEVSYSAEDQIWADVEKICGFETDLLVINRAPARVAYSALSEGSPLYIADRSLYLRVLCATGRLFEEYGEFTESYMRIKERSSSLSDIDRDRLIRIIDFLETELEDSSQFENITYEHYMANSGMRRNLERWIENCVNASIDAAKVLIASRRQHIPQTYRETIERLKTLEGFPESTVDALAKNTKLKNILAHEYLDIRFSHIKTFVQNAETDYRSFTKALREFLHL